MKQEIFDKGFKALIRYLKEIGKYPCFIKYSAHYNPQYKNKLKKEFDARKDSWYQFFSFTYYVGEDYSGYEDPSLNETRKGWREYIEEKHPELR